MEKEILDYIDCTYLIYGRNEQLVTAHPKMKRYLADLSFDQDKFQNLGVLLNSLRDVQLNDEVASFVLREKAFVRPNDLFCGIVSVGEQTFLAQVQRKLSGSFAVFSDVSIEYQYISEAGDFPRSFIQSQKIEALGNMASGIAHDLNNVLSIIKGYARMMEWDKGITEDTKERVESIIKAVDRGSDLTGQILDFGSHHAQKKETLQLGTVIENQKILLQPLLNEKFFLSMDLDYRISIETSSDHVFQILMNLVVNARDSMDGGGNIKIKLNPVDNRDLPFVSNERDNPDGYCCLSVSDQGSGMTKEVKSRIFESYYTTKERGKGTGMGMAVVKSIMRDLNAQAEIISEPNQGAEVKLFIPMKGKVGDSLTTPTSETLKSKTVLVVENDVDLLTILSAAFSEKDMIVLTAENGHEALNIEKKYCEDIDFLVSDIVLPRLNGVDLAVAFQTLRPSTKIFMISGYPANAFPEDIRIPRGMSIITKPINFEDLEDKMLRSIPSILHEEESLSNMAGIA